MQSGGLTNRNALGCGLLNNGKIVLLFGGKLGITVGQGALRLSNGTHDNGNFQRLLDGVY
jgi:hypothetical protein